MPRNVEVKLRIVPPATLATLAERVAALAQRAPESIAQEDCFFHVPHGRLKLRIFGNGTGELIAYAREDSAGLRTSDYVRCAVAEPAALREALARSCGLRGRVRKDRTVFTVGPTRVHLDRVEGLGDFLELEVVLQPAEPETQGEAVARRLLDTLGLADAPPIAGAYIDLLEAAASSRAPRPGPPTHDPKESAP